MVLERLDVAAAVVDRAVVAPASLLIAEGVIVAVGPPAEIGEVDLPTTRLDGTLVPGFVDLQVNGFAGRQFGMHPDALEATARPLLATGVTAFCPTITTRPWDRYEHDLAMLAPTASTAGPRNLGLHLEGPFLSPVQAGAHDRTSLRAANVGELEQLLGWAPTPVAIVTLAPELDGGEAVVRALRAAGIVASAGHTDATYEQLREAVTWGVTMITHLFNAQRGLGHRDPGVAGGGLLLGEVTVGVILDGHHVHPDLAAMVLEVAAGRVVAVTDAVATAGLEEGVHDFDGILLDTSSGAPRLADGTLAGSNLTMDAAFRFVARRHGLVAAVAATATTAARVVGRDDLGSIARTAAADLVLLDGEQQVRSVWLAGERVVTS